MRKKVLAFLLMVCFLFSISVSLAQSPPPIGVKAGDWIEFNATTSGNLPPGHEVIWFKLEVINTTATDIWINIVAEAPNGTLSSSIRDVDFSTGDTQAWIIIPANLSPGNSFYDNLTNSTVTIQGENTTNIAGASRTTTYVNTPQRHKEWDKATGVFVQTSDYYPDYNVTATAYATNMWAPQILGLDPTVFYAILSNIIILVAAILIVIAFRRKK